MHFFRMFFHSIPRLKVCLKQAQIFCHLACLGGVCHTKFLDDVLPMTVDRVDTPMQKRSNLLAAYALLDKAKHLNLPVRKNVCAIMLRQINRFACDRIDDFRGGTHIRSNIVKA